MYEETFYGEHFIINQAYASQSISTEKRLKKQNKTLHK